MKIDVRLLGLFLLCVFAFSVVGCFLRREQDEEEPEEVTATVVSVNPASGSTIPANATITVTFDNPPREVITNVGAISVAGKIATITGPFETGTLALTITWADGQQVLSYTVPKVEDKGGSETVPAEPADEPEEPEVEPAEPADEPEEPEVEPEEPADFISANPSSGSTLLVNASITLAFDKPPGDVKVSAGSIRVTGKNATITGPFTPGALRVVITWADKQHVLNYTVTRPDVDAPKVTVSTVRDGETDVDPDRINTNGIIEVAFNEAVKGQIELQNETGRNVGWRGKVEGSKATLELVRGRELTYETTYIIAGKVEDAAGNPTDVKITFTTEPEPDNERPQVTNIVLPGSDGTGVVDTQTINNAGRIEFTFNEVVNGTITLLTEDREEVGWRGDVTGNKAILELVRGEELRPGTKYIAHVVVSDAARNRRNLELDFTTTGGPPPLIEGMVHIPAGAFRMGSDGVEARGDEQPVHSVHLNDFYIDEYEVTNAEYKVFILANPQWQKNKIAQKFHDGNYLKRWNGNNYPLDRDDDPVRFVSWYAAMAYAEWAGKRLPTEAEWEKAARGKLVGQKYPWGNTIDRDKANYNQHMRGTTPVGSYPANNYDLYDMAGNVSEWCLDEAIPNFYAHSPRNNPIAGGPLKHIIDNFRDIETPRIIRGGSLRTTAANTRVAKRSARRPEVAPSDTGFRCVFVP